MAIQKGAFLVISKYLQLRCEMLYLNCTLQNNICYLVDLKLRFINLDVSLQWLITLLYHLLTWTILIIHESLPFVSCTRNTFVNGKSSTYDAANKTLIPLHIFFLVYLKLTCFCMTPKQKNKDISLQFWQK